MVRTFTNCLVSEYNKVSFNDPKLKPIFEQWIEFF